MQPIAVEYRKVEALIPYARNAKQHTDAQVAQIAASRSRGLAKLLNALGIRHVGPRVATLLCDRFPTIDALAAHDGAGLFTVIDQVIDAASNTFRVRLALDNADRAVPAGARCQIDLGLPSP